MERTIFYQNDAQGVLELKKAIEKAESEIDFSKIGSPIYDILHSIGRDVNILQIAQNDMQAGQEVLPYILEKLNKLEDMFLANKSSNSTPFYEWEVHLSFSVTSGKDYSSAIKDAMMEVFRAVQDIKPHQIEHGPDGVDFSFSVPANYSSSILTFLFIGAFSCAGFKDVVCTGISRA